MDTNFNFNLRGPVTQIPLQGLVTRQSYEETAQYTRQVTTSSNLSSAERERRKAKAANLEKVFIKYDSDGSELIDRSELKTMLEELGLDASSGHLTNLIKCADTVVTDNEINFAEFYEAYMHEKLPVDYISPNNLDVYAGTHRSRKHRSTPSFDGFSGGQVNTTIITQETPAEITALYQLITRMESYEGCGDENKTKLRSLVEELIREFDENVHLSSQATANIARTMISEFNSTNTEIQDLKLQISSLEHQRTEIDQRYQYIIQGIKDYGLQLDQNISTQKNYVSSQTTIISNESNVFTGRKVQDEEAHKLRMSEQNVQIQKFRQEMNVEIQSHESSLRYQYDAIHSQYTEEIITEKKQVQELKRQLQFHIDLKRGHLSDQQKIQEALLRAFREEVEKKKSELVSYFNDSKGSDLEKLRAAKKQFDLNEHDYSQHQQQKHQIIREMDQMKQAFKDEQDQFAQEKAQWLAEHERNKQSQLTVIRSERELWIKQRNEQNASFILQIEEKKAENQRQIMTLEQDITNINVQITNVKNTNISHQFIEERKALDAKTSDFEIRLKRETEKYKKTKVSVQMSIDEQWRAFRAEKADYDRQHAVWTQEWSEIVDIAMNQGNIIKLNVGGRNFDVTIANLTSVRDSRLAMMFQHWHKTQGLLPKVHDRIFLDRDPQYFDLLLNYIASQGQTCLFSNSDHTFESKMFNNELKFWKISPSSEFIIKKQDTTGKKYTFDSHGKPTKSITRDADLLRTEI